MTMPHLMNCSHSPDGWCLDCVKEEWDKNHPPQCHKCNGSTGEANGYMSCLECWASGLSQIRPDALEHNTDYIVEYNGKLEVGTASRHRVDSTLLIAMEINGQVHGLPDEAIKTFCKLDLPAIMMNLNDGYKLVLQDLQEAADKMLKVPAPYGAVAELRKASANASIALIFGQGWRT